MTESSHDSNIKTETVSEFTGLLSHWTAWDQLAWHAPQRLPTLLPAWVDAFLQHCLKPRESWFCCFAYKDDRLVGVLPVIVTPHAFIGSARPILRTPSDKETTWSGDIPLATDCAAAALSALLSETRRQSPKHVGMVMRKVRDNSPLWNALSNGVQDYTAYHGWSYKGSVVDVAENFEGYLARLGNLRRNLKRYRTRLDRKGLVSITVKQAVPGEEKYFSEFMQLEASGWKGVEGTAISDSPWLTNFYTALVRKFAEQERLEWHFLQVNGRLVAAGLGLHCSASLMLPKIAFDENYADCMPGNLLTEAVIKDAFSRPDVHEINHMSDQQWHRAWHMGHHFYQDLYLVRNNALSMLVQRPIIAAELAARSAQHRLPGAQKVFHNLRSSWRQGIRRLRQH